MKHTSLAARYRPQTFTAVTGQTMVTAVLSRAAAEDKVAPAYLLSGTRGVGKTTIARILAKTLNCVTAPTAEPCNQCEQCRKITQGIHVDVMEIDGASNNSVEDARALRETIGYAPMEGRYKVFIIDEAHMLSKNAFNALLKTLEEPPARVVFIFATTEAHRFPITIISRCQHFIFKRVPEEGLAEHITRVLTLEEAPFDSKAVRLLARRAAGSVRDAMSLLGQILAFGENGLTLEATRTVLGLAGQEFFENILEAMATQDIVTVVNLTHQLMDQGVDIGFFLRELTSLWRTLFLLRHAGQSIVPSLQLADDEAAVWLALSQNFSVAHIHAAWHMTLDAQRKVIHSPEPAAALELLLLNVTLIPRLLPLNALTPTTDTKTPLPKNLVPSSVPQQPQVVQGTPLKKVEKSVEEDRQENRQENVKADTVAQKETQAAEQVAEQSVTLSTKQATPINVTPLSHAASILPEPVPQAITVQKSTVQEPTEQAGAPIVNKDKSTEVPTWENIREYLENAGKGHISRQCLRQVQGSVQGKTITLHTASQTVYEQLERADNICKSLCSEYYGMAMNVHILPPTKVYESKSALKERFAKHEALQEALTILHASIIDVRDMA